ncbi:MAG: 3-oxoacyl-[acyl-carrier-protein] synthase 3 [Chlamydiia bacterium]|nr:3-oxoacyl-[acyl-carrier-protein] synthase 3 [Chlamydiia bacterium]
MGRYLPERILTNADLEKMVDTSDEWIYTRTGMKARRIAAEDEFPSTMGAKAAINALEEAQIGADEVDLIICATLTPDYIFPSTACLIQEQIGAKNASAFDFQAACTGFVYALSIAKAFVESGVHKNVLLVATEKLSSIIDYTDRTTCVLFGDGAAAAVISSEKSPGVNLKINRVFQGADGALADRLILPGGGSRVPPSIESVERGDHFLKMEGKEVFKHAVRKMKDVSVQAVEENGFELADISYLVSHQANVRIINAVAERCQIPKEKVKMTIEKYGNTSASSIGLCLCDMQEKSELKDGDHLLLCAFGAGLTWGATVLSVEGEDNG